MKKINFKYPFLLLLLYIYLYNPIFQYFDFGLIKLLLLISVGYIITSKKSQSFITLFKNEIFFCIILIIYSIFAGFSGNGTAYDVPYKHLIWFLESFCIPYFFMYYFKDLILKKTWEAIIVQIGFIASLITLFLILNPEINIYIRESIIRESLTSANYAEKWLRGFTIAENSVYDYGIIQGLILSVCIISVKKNILYAIPVLFLFISILFNARIGFSVLIITISLMVLRRNISVKHILFFSLSISVAYFLLSQSELYRNNVESFKWGLSFFEDTIKFSKGQDSSSGYSIMIENMVFLPSNIVGLLFGEGRTVFAGIKQSDIGYINSIFIGGIFYLLLILFFLYYMFKRNIKHTTNILLSLTFFLTLIVANIKGNALFMPLGFSRLITFYYIYCILLKNQSKSDDYAELSTNKDVKKDKLLFPT